MAVKPQTIGITENTNTIPSAEQRNSKPLTFILKSKAENNSVEAPNNNIAIDDGRTDSNKADFLFLFVKNVKAIQIPLTSATMLTKTALNPTNPNVFLGELDTIFAVIIIAVGINKNK